MNFSIESRVPFLDTKFVEYMLSLPEEYLVSDRGQSKYVFRHAMKDIVPSEILNRKDKIGFEMPQKQWLYELSSHKKSLLETASAFSFFDIDKMKPLFLNNSPLSKRASNKQWRLVNFLKWCEIFNVSCS